MLEDKITRSQSIPKRLKMLIALNHLRTGSYEHSVGQNFLHPVSQQSVSRCTREIVNAIVDLAPQYIQFPSTGRDRQNTATKLVLIYDYL